MRSRPEGTATPPGPADPTRPRIGPGVLLCVAQFVTVLDVTIVAVALPAMRAGLGFSVVGVQWVVTAYTLVFAGSLLLAGRVADLYGRRPVFRVGLAAFAVTSLLCALAQQPSQLVAARVLQGASAAALSPAALAMLVATYHGRARTKALGWWTAAAAGGGGTGFVLSGLLTDLFGWRSVFAVTVPVGVIGALVAGRVLPRWAGERTHRLDVAGAVTATGSLVLVSLGFVQLESYGVADLQPWLVLASAAALLAAFVAVERRHTEPLVPLATFSRPGFARGVIVAVLLTAITSPTNFMAIFHLQDVLGYPARTVGLVAAPFSAAVVAGSLAGGRVVARYGERVAMCTGFCGLALAQLCFTAISVSGAQSLAAVAAGFVTSGASLGLASVGSTALGTSALADRDQGLAAGVLNTAAQVGTGLGVAALLSVALARTDGLVAAGVSPPEAAVSGYRLAYLVALGLVALGILASGRRRRR